MTIHDKESVWKRIYWKVFDLIPSSLYCFYVKHFKIKAWLNRFKYIHQRLARGFDDRELWNMEDSFYRGIQKRLEIFVKRYELYNNDERFAKEINENIERLKIINEYDWRTTHSIEDDKEIFLKWFSENLHRLWF